MTVKPFDDERLAELLRLLKPVPRALVARAKRIPLGAPGADEVAELARRLEADSAFRVRFDADPVEAVESAGLYELAAQLRFELAELAAAPHTHLADGIGALTETLASPAAINQSSAPRT